MLELASFFLTLAVGSIGGALGAKSKIPAGIMVGALLSVMIINLTTNMLYFPRDFRIIVQLIAGVTIGSQITRDDVRGVRAMLWPCILMMAYFSIMMVLNGLMLWKLCGMDLVTALFGCSPGGFADMGVISSDFGANAAVVSVMQLSRIVCVALVYPLIFKFLEKRGIIERRAAGQNQNKRKQGSVTAKEKVAGTSIYMVSGILTGLVFHFLRFPAGAIVGAMVGSAAISIYSPKKYYMESRLRVGIQVLAGVFIATLISRDDLELIASSALIIAIMIANMLTLSLVCSYVIYKLTKMEPGTVIFGAAPGGLQEISIIAQDMGMDIPKISIIHTLRIAGSLAIFPSLISFIVSAFS